MLFRSNPIYKSDQADLTPDKTELEYDNMVFAGTTVSSGSGHFIILSTSYPHYPHYPH